MTPDEIRTHPLFTTSLTDRQRIFVDHLLKNGNDKVKAAHASWTCGSDESARTLANRALANEHVAFLVESYFGKDPEKLEFTRQAALEFAAKKAKNANDDKIALDYLRLIVAMNGWLVKPADKPDTPQIDDSNEVFEL